MQQKGGADRSVCHVGDRLGPGRGGDAGQSVVGDVVRYRLELAGLMAEPRLVRVKESLQSLRSPGGLPADAEE